jgi:hypothetical protein
MSAGPRTSRTLLVMLRKPFSEKASVRMLVARRMSSHISRISGDAMNSHAAGDEAKR